MLRRLVFAFAVVANLLLVDQVVKEYAVRVLRVSGPVEWWPGVFGLNFTVNHGCAWGMFQGHVWPLAAFAVVALVLLIWRRRDIFPEGRWGAVAEVTLYAGILGNLIDRVVRGGVVDMFDYHGGFHFPVFNVADVYINIAAAILIGHGLFCSKKADGTKEKDAADGRA